MRQARRTGCSEAFKESWRKASTITGKDPAASWIAMVINTNHQHKDRLKKPHHPKDIIGMQTDGWEGCERPSHRLVQGPDPTKAACGRRRRRQGSPTALLPLWGGGSTQVSKAFAFPNKPRSPGLLPPPPDIWAAWASSPRLGLTNLD